tara:strand:- start:1803 stop:2225 length:423 start_codon:yes stop_codon:yes gene_type:complete
MAVTIAQIRAMLGQPRGLLDDTITEYISIRTLEVNKKRRSSTLYGVSSDNAVSDDLVDAAIKALVSADCLSVMVDVIPTFYPEKEQGAIEQRYKTQARVFRERADDLLKEVADKGGTAFYLKKTNTRLDSTSSSFNDSTL